MSPRLVIRLFADGTSQWLALARDGSRLAGPGDGLPAEPADEVALLLPAEDVLLIEAPRLARRASQLAQALPFAIEEQLAGPVESQHVAFDEHGKGAQVAVAVVARERIERALAQLRSAGQSADSAHSIAQLLPLEPGQLSVLLDHDQAVLRWATSGAMTCAAEALVPAIELLRDAGVSFDRVRMWHTPGRLPMAPAGIALASSELPDVLAWLAERLPAASAPDLLQGPFRARRRRGRLGAQWRLAAALAAAAVLAGVLNAGVERIALERHVDARRAEMEHLLREAIPGTQRIVDPVAQLAAELDRRGGGDLGGAIPLLAKVAPLISGSGRFTIEALDYRVGALELTVSAPDVAALDGLRAALAALPLLQVELTSALPGSNGYEGRLRIREGAA